MARIRSIHPGIFTDEAFMTLTVEQPLAVVLLMGLWTEADDEGVFEWKPLTIKARVLPAVSCDAAPILAALVEHQFVMRFEVDGRPFGAIRNFMRFQRPKKPNSIHPKTEAVLAYVGMASETVGNQFGTGVENPPQMEDGGGKREEEQEDHTAGASMPAPQRSRQDLDDLEAALRATAASVLDDAAPGLLNLAPILSAISGGCDLEMDVLPAIREVAARPSRGPPRRVRSWEFFTDAIRQAHARRTATLPEVTHDRPTRHPGRQPTAHDLILSAMADESSRRDDLRRAQGDLAGSFGPQH